jgi:hypothetical protein
MVGMLVSRTSRAFSKRARERSRVAAHIARAEKFARENGPALDPLRSLVRALLLDALREYREEGTFPENHRRPCNTPVFVDERGTHCAVGHLLALSGERALVAKIAAERNLATVFELSDEPALVQWLDAIGLSLHEAELVQPFYSPACSTAAQCFCQPYTTFLTGATSMTANAVLDCTMTSANTARIDRIHGATTGHAVGDSINVRAFRGEPGARALVPVLSDGTQPRIATPSDDAGVAGLLAIGVGTDGTATCNGYGLNVPPVLVRARAQSVIAALTTNDCAGAMAVAEPSSTQRQCNGCACAVPARSARSEAPTATLSILLALVSALTVRRARRARRSPEARQIARE